MPFNLEAFIQRARQAGSADAVAELMRETVADAEAVRAELARVADGQMVLHQADDLTVLNVTIPPRFRTGPHNHLMWAVVGIYEGQEDNHFYQQEGDRLAEIERREVKAPDVLSLPETVIHAIANPLAVPTRGLHVYGGHLEDAPRTLWDPDTFAQARYDQQRAMAISRRLMERAKAG